MFETREDWLKWRKDGIGSSDAPIILGLSGFMTPRELWADKLNPEIKEESSFITDMGDRMEIGMRGLFNIHSGMNMQPELYQDQENPWLRASLDGGWNQFAIECKLLSRIDSTDDKTVNYDSEGMKKWLKAQEGQKVFAEQFKGTEKESTFNASEYIPADHYAQCQHILMVSKKACVFYLGYVYDKADGKEFKIEKLAVVRVYPNAKFQGYLFEEQVKFWDCVLKKKEPQPCKGDYKEFKVKGITAKVHKWKQLDREIAELMIMRDQIRDDILNEAEKQGHDFLTCKDVRIQRIVKAGSVQWAKHPEIKKLNDQIAKIKKTLSEDEQNKLRQKGSSHWRMEVISE